MAGEGRSGDASGAHSLWKLQVTVTSLDIAVYRRCLLVLLAWKGRPRVLCVEFKTWHRLTPE